MSRKNACYLIVSLLAVGVLIFFLYPGIRSTDSQCKLCGEEIHEGMGFTIMQSGGGKIKTCCPTCGLHLQVHNPDKVLSAYAKDHVTGKTIDAARAYYVVGSDVHHCNPKRMMRNEVGDVFMMVWHRCEPSLVAFGTREAAAAFQSQHGGSILSFSEATDVVKTH